MVTTRKISKIATVSLSGGCLYPSWEAAVLPMLARMPNVSCLLIDIGVTPSRTLSNDDDVNLIQYKHLVNNQLLPV